MTDPARTSVALSVAAMISAALGWGAFGWAIVLGDHFSRADPRSAFLLLLWALLGLLALAVWIGACVTAVRARKLSLQGARRATTLALLAPGTWAVEFGLLIVWFGYEALSGPWPH